MKQPEPGDALDALLQADDNYVEDAGFTARVISALPPRRRRAALRPAILLGATLIGFALLAWLLPPVKSLVTFSNGGVAFAKQSLVLLGIGVVVVASLFWGLIAAVRWDD